MSLLKWVLMGLVFILSYATTVQLSTQAFLEESTEMGVPRSVAMNSGKMVAFSVAGVAALSLHKLYVIFGMVLAVLATLSFSMVFILTIANIFSR